MVTRIFFNQLVSRKQLKPFESANVVSANFNDDSYREFCITFKFENGKQRDLMIAFETRIPRIYVSRPY